MEHQLPFARVNVPDDWEDKTTHQFLSPILEEPDEKKKKVAESHKLVPRLAMFVSKLHLKAGKSLDEAIKEEEEQMKNSLPKFKVLEKTHWEHPTYGKAPVSVIAFEGIPNCTLVQARAFVQGEDESNVANVTFSCEQALYDKHQEEFVKLFANVQLNN